MKRKLSFSTRLSLNIVLISSIIFIVTIAGAAISSHLMIAEEAKKSAENLLDATILNIEKMLQRVEDSVRGESWLLQEHINDEQYLYHITQKLVSENDNIVGSAIAFRQSYFPDRYFFSPYSFRNKDTNKIESLQLGNPNYNYFYMDWFQIPSLLGTPCWSEPYYDEGGANRLLSTYSYPLKDENGQVFAIVSADIDLTVISEYLATIKPYPNSNVLMIGRSGTFITLGNNNELAGETFLSVVYKMKDSYSGLDKVAHAMLKGEKGTMKFHKKSTAFFTVFGPLSNGWKACITCNYREVLSRASIMHIIITLLALIGLAILFVLCFRTLRLMTKPLLDMSTSAKSIAEGDFDTDLPVLKHDDELKDLRDSFDNMQHSIKDYISELKVTTAANERFESELNVANKIQMSMVPSDFPDMDKVNIFAKLIPAKEVGGDLYDFFIQDNILYFAIGDVSGKGVPASLFMAITKYAFRLISKIGMPLDKVMQEVNNAISEGNERAMFVTMFIGKINLDSGKFEYCNAGHNPLVRIDSEGKASFMQVIPNIVVGLFSGYEYKMQECTLNKNTRLILYTDGVTEAERYPDKALFGEDRLLESLSKTIGKNVQECCQTLYEDIKTFTNGNNQNDDITILAIDLKG